MEGGKKNICGGLCLLNLCYPLPLSKLSPDGLPVSPLETIHHRDNHIHHLQLLLGSIIMRRNAAP